MSIDTPCKGPDAETGKSVIRRAEHNAAASLQRQRPQLLNPQLTGNVGLYYCCYQLSLRGWNVMPTARNAKGVDLIAYSQDGARMIGIQVKSLTKRNPMPLGTTLEKVVGNFWVIINRVTSCSPKVFVLTPDEVRDWAFSSKSGKVSFWLQPNAYENDTTRNAWHRIGMGDIA